MEVLAWQGKYAWCGTVQFHVWFRSCSVVLGLAWEVGRKGNVPSTLWLGHVTVVGEKT